MSQQAFNTANAKATPETITYQRGTDDAASIAKSTVLNGMQAS